MSRIITYISCINYLLKEINLYKIKYKYFKIKNSLVDMFKIRYKDKNIQQRFKFKSIKSIN